MKMERRSEREVRRRVQARANAWSAVECVMADQRFSKRLNAKVMSTCVIRNGNVGTDRNTTTKAAANVPKQLGAKNSKNKEGKQEKNDGV